MNVGITYDLRDDYLKLGYSPEQAAEFDSEETIQAIDAALAELGYGTERIGGVRRLTELLAAGRRWDIVFNIAEGMYGAGREAQVPALLDAYRIPYTFSDPLVLCLTLDKALAKQAVRAAGLATPDHRIIQDEAELSNWDMAFPVFAKPLREGTGKGVDASSLVRNQLALRGVVSRLLHHFGPVLVESYLPGREFTVGVVGAGASARSVGVMEIHLLNGADAGCYTQRNKEDCASLVRYDLAFDEQAQAAADLAVSCYRVLGCRDAGRVDVRLDAQGRPHFLEVNPLAGLHPTHSDLPILWSLGGGRYLQLIRSIMDAAMTRRRVEDECWGGVNSIRPARPATGTRL
jgi:D-alanine-D-alanine ligase